MGQHKPFASLAAAAAALALSPLAPASDNPPGSTGKAISAGDKVHCYGMHFCSKFHECGSPKNACKAPNKCNGRFQTTTAKDCLEKDGTIADFDE